MKKSLLAVLLALLTGFCISSCSGGAASADSVAQVPSFDKDSPSYVVDRLYTCFKNNQYEAIIPYLSGAETATQEDLDFVVELFSYAFDEEGGVADYKIVSETIDESGTKAKVALSVLYRNNSEWIDDEIDLVKNGEIWQVDFFEE